MKKFFKFKQPITGNSLFNFTGIVTLISCIVAVVVVPEVRKLLSLDQEPSAKPNALPASLEGTNLEPPLPYPIQKPTAVSTSNEKAIQDYRRMQEELKLKGIEALEPGINEAVNGGRISRPMAEALKDHLRKEGIGP